MFGNKIFPVICVLLSVAQFTFAQRPFRVIRHSPRPSSWGFPNEIYGSGGGPAFRPPPGVLIAGHRPPVSRPRGPVHAGSRLVPLFSTSTPLPSAWPSAGPQIQKAQETSHFEYEVYPHPMNQRKVYRAQPQPPRLMRPLAPALLRSPLPTHDPVHVPQELLRILAQDGIEAIPSPKPQSRTDRPPLMGLRYPQPTLPSPNSPNFQEGFGILSDLFMEEAGADIRNNLVGGSEISFNGNYYPIAGINAATASRGNNSSAPLLTKPGNAPAPTPSPNVEIAPAKEHVINVPIETNNKEAQQKTPVKSAAPPPIRHSQMQQSESSYSHPHYHPGPESSHVSFMFQDPHEAPIQPSYNIYDGEYGGPPPPFHTGGNSAIPPQLSSQNGPTQEELDGYQSHPRLQSPQNEVTGYNKPQPQRISNSIRSQKQQVMALRIPQLPAGSSNNEPPPSSEEVQLALRVLSRYASQQGQGMTPQQLGLQLAASQNTEYQSDPEMAIEISASPNSEYGSAPPPPSTQYGAPKQEQSTPVPSYLPPSSVTPSEMGGSTSHMQGPSSHYTSASTTENSNTITVTASGQESSPFPQYGPPGPGLGLSGYEGVSGGNDGGYGGGVSGGYDGGSGGWSSGGSGGGASDLIGAKVKALKSIQSAVTGGFKQITGIKAGILNAGLNAIGSIGKAKGDIANSLKIPIVPVKTSYGPIEGYGSTEVYGPPTETTLASGWGAPTNGKDGLVSTLINGVGGVVGGIVGTVAQTGKAAVGIGLSKKEFVKNHFAIKGQAVTQTFSKKIANKNQYFQNVLKHVQSIFEAANKPITGSGWRR